MQEWQLWPHEACTGHGIVVCFTLNKKVCNVKMLTAILNKMGFVSQEMAKAMAISESKQAVEAYIKQKNQNKLECERNINIGRPVITLTNAENAISIGIISDYMTKDNSFSSSIPIVKTFYCNRNDHENFVPGEEQLCFATCIEYSEERLKALLKLTGAERTLLFTEIYKHGRDKMNFPVLADKQPEYEEIVNDLKKTSFFEESELYYQD